MSDYYYENDIVPPNIHFKKPFWLKEDKTENDEKENESKDKCEEKGDKLKFLSIWKRVFSPIRFIGFFILL